MNKGNKTGSVIERMLYTLEGGNNCSCAIITGDQKVTRLKMLKNLKIRIIPIYLKFLFYNSNYS